MMYYTIEIFSGVLCQRNGAIEMANHLDLKSTHGELDGQGNLTLFQDGRSVCLLALEVKQLLHWLSQGQRPTMLQVGKVQLTFGGGRGLLCVTCRTEAVRVPAQVVRQIVQWLRH